LRPRPLTRKWPAMAPKRSVGPRTCQKSVKWLPVGCLPALAPFQASAPGTKQSRRPCCDTLCGYPVKGDLYRQHVLMCSVSTASGFLDRVQRLSAREAVELRREVATLVGDMELAPPPRLDSTDAPTQRSLLLSQIASALPNECCSQLLYWMRSKVHELQVYRKSAFPTSLQAHVAD
jgi:hypothetical protein